MERFCPYCLSPVQPGTACPACWRDWEAYQPSSHHIPPGSLLHGRYRVGRVLGEGGFGITYLGRDTVLDQRVAIKEYFPTFLVSREVSVTLDVTCHTSGNQPTYEKGREQFLREAQTMAKLDEIPEIVRVKDHFPEHNTAYIVMEFLEGKTLKELTAQNGPIPAPDLLTRLGAVLRAMEAMHQAGIIHRDISPDNLMELKNGTIKLMDFGCARDFQGSQTETITLKHGFAPREQYTGRDQGPWTDVYALCATVYYCLTGKVPPRATLRDGGEQDPLIPPRQLGAELTQEQERALLRGLAPKAKDRWQSAAELYAALYGQTMEGAPWQETERRESQDSQGETQEKGEKDRHGPAKPAGRPKWFKAGAAAACGILLVGAVLAFPRLSCPTHRMRTAFYRRTLLRHPPRQRRHRRMSACSPPAKIPPCPRRISTRNRPQSRNRRRDRDRVPAGRPAPQVRWEAPPGRPAKALPSRPLPASRRNRRRPLRRSWRPRRRPPPATDSTPLRRRPTGR